VEESPQIIHGINFHGQFPHGKQPLLDSHIVEAGARWFASPWPRGHGSSSHGLGSKRASCASCAGDGWGYAGDLPFLGVLAGKNSSENMVEYGKSRN